MLFEKITDGNQSDDDQDGGISNKDDRTIKILLVDD